MSTFGKIDIGTDTAKHIGGRIWASKHTLHENAIVTYISVYGTDGSGTYRMAIYDDNYGTPNNLICETEEINYERGWTTGVASASLTPGIYWIAWQQSAPFIISYYDITTESRQTSYLDYAYGPFPKLFGEPNFQLAHVYSLYATYTTLECLKPNASFIHSGEICI